MTNSKIITNFLNDVLKAEYTEGFVDNARYNWHIFHKFYWVFAEVEIPNLNKVNGNAWREHIETIGYLMCNDQTPENAFDKLAEAVEWFNSVKK